MEIKKNDNYFEVIFDTAKFLLDPPKIYKNTPIILTDKTKNLNQDKIFNLSGEYNVGEVFLYGFDNKNDLSFLFNEYDYFFLYFRKNLDEGVLKQIKMITKEVDIILSPEIENINIIKELKTACILTNKKIDLPKFKKEEGNKIKINPKKVENLIFIFK